MHAVEVHVHVVAVDDGVVAVEEVDEPREQPARRRPRGQQRQVLREHRQPPQRRQAPAERLPGGAVHPVELHDPRGEVERLAAVGLRVIDEGVAVALAAEVADGQRAALEAGVVVEEVDRLRGRALVLVGLEEGRDQQLVPALAARVPQVEVEVADQQRLADGHRRVAVRPPLALRRLLVHVAQLAVHAEQRHRFLRPAPRALPPRGAPFRRSTPAHVVICSWGFRVRRPCGQRSTAPRER
ncbi:MAG: hypothetical protein OXH75_02705 [Acidobacteria bacterium]|nr:hypothetical protein [Acidobacteriota bacterium]